MPAVRQKLHLSSCADFRGQLSPRVCVADSKQHIRAFLAEALEGLRFITCECGRANDLVAVLDNHLPDLVVLGMSAGGVAAGEMLKVLAAKAFSGKVLLLGPGGSPVVEALCKMGEELGVAMLPPLATPFRIGGLRASVAAFLGGRDTAEPAGRCDRRRACWPELWLPSEDRHAHSPPA